MTKRTRGMNAGLIKLVWGEGSVVQMTKPQNKVPRLPLEIITIILDYLVYLMSGNEQSKPAISLQTFMTVSRQFLHCLRKHPIHLRRKRLKTISTICFLSDCIRHGSKEVNAQREFPKTVEFLFGPTPMRLCFWIAMEEIYVNFSRTGVELTEVDALCALIREVSDTDESIQLSIQGLAEPIQKMLFENISDLVGNGGVIEIQTKDDDWVQFVNVRGCLTLSGEDDAEWDSSSEESGQLIFDSDDFLGSSSSYNL